MATYKYEGGKIVQVYKSGLTTPVSPSKVSYAGHYYNASPTAVQEYIQSAYGHLLARRPAALDLNTFWLAKGAHSPGNQGCVMEYASALAGEEWSDHPACVSPFLGGILRGWNDTLDNVDRQRLRSFAFRALDTNTGCADDWKRAWLAVDWLFRVGLATWLEVIGAKDLATHLRERPPITSEGDVEALDVLIGRAEALVRDEPLIQRSGTGADVPSTLRLGVFAEWQMARAASTVVHEGSLTDGIVHVALAVMGKASNMALGRAARLGPDGCRMKSYAAITGASLSALSRELHESALATVAAMCEIGRTPVVETKVRELATAHAKDAWLDELEAEVKGNVEAALAARDA